MKVAYRAALLVAITGYVCCQSINDLDVDDIKKKLGDNIPELESFNKTHLPKAEDVEKILKEKCAKRGAADAVDTLKDEQENVKLCVERYVNFTVVQEELEEAKKTGSMDEVFGKYCRMWPGIYGCFENVTSAARACMDDREQKAFNKSLDILNDLQSFMCFKDGDRLAMFVAEGGVECVKERKDGVQDCINATLGERIPDPDDLSVSNVPSFLFTGRDCEDFEKVRLCVNEELEKCKDSTPANIVDAFFKFLKKQMPCGSDGEKPVKAKMAESTAAGSWSVTVAASTLLLVFTSLAVKAC